MITPILNWQTNNITWYEFHDSRNENSMLNITERVIHHYDMYEKISVLHSQLHNLHGGVRQVVDKSIKSYDYSNYKFKQIN